MTLGLAAVLGFALVLIRASTLVALAPVLGSRAVPARIKLAISLVAAIVSWTAAGTPSVVPPPGLVPLAGLVISEALVGMAAGLSSRLVLDATQAGGQAAAMSMGFGYGALINPHSGAESSVVGELMGALTLAMAVAMGLHREALVWLAASVREVPPGLGVDVQQLATGLIRQVIYAVALAVRVAYPLFAGAILGHSALGIIGRTAPQLSLSNVGFAVTIATGGGVLYVNAPQAARICAEAAVGVFTRQ